jgi:transketolase
MPDPSITVLSNLAAELRIDSVLSTTEAGSGHPTTCLSAADIIAAVFFAEMRFDPQDPQHPDADRFVLSKGHAAPILYSAWALAGAFPRSDVMQLRSLTSDLEGHPTPRLPFVDVATGSLGQGLCAGVGIALNARRIASDYRTYVLLGDGETAEGSVWEAAHAAAFHKLDNLCGITDVNGFGQSRTTQWDRDLDEYAARWHAFGWHTIKIDGHDMRQIVDALAEARKTTGRPTMIVARTLKGKGCSIFEGKENWHGKALKKGAETDAAIAEIKAQIKPTPDPAPVIPKPARRTDEGALPSFTAKLRAPAYKLGDIVATREAYGTALAALGDIDRRVVALDADVKNSTFSERFEKAHPDRFYQMFIAEQGMVGASMGLAARGAIPFPSTFAAFLERACDFVRMAGMALEDLAMFRGVPNCTVFYPSDAMSAERLVALAADTPGLVYIRTTRPKTPVIYDTNETFTVGGSKTLRQSEKDVATVVAAGVTLPEALKAHDELASAGIAIRVIDLYCVQPIDRDALVAAGRATNGRIITVEDHYAHGGIGDAVSEAVWDQGFRVQRLAVREIPRSGPPEVLLDKYGISARAIADAVKALR